MYNAMQEQEQEAREARDILGWVLMLLCIAVFIAALAYRAGQVAEDTRKTAAMAECKADSNLIMTNGYTCHDIVPDYLTEITRSK